VLVQRVNPCPQIGRRLVDVRNADASAGADLGRAETCRSVHIARKGHEGLHQYVVWLELQDLRANMRVIAKQRNRVGGPKGKVYRASSTSVRDWDSKLTVLNASLQEAMRVRLNSRIESQQHLRSRSNRAGEADDRVKFLHAIDNDRSNSTRNGFRQQGNRLVVAMQSNAVRFDASTKCYCELRCRAHVNSRAQIANHLD
jgi:hypothetical protein